VNENGNPVKLDEPQGMEMPPDGFEVKEKGFQAPAEDGSRIQVIIKEGSERLQLLEHLNPGMAMIIHVCVY